MDTVHLIKVTEPSIFHSMVKMHLSFLLDLHTDECDCSFLYEKQEKESRVKKAFTPMKKKTNKGVMDGVPLTQEGVCQVYQIIEYLGRSHNITTEGLFRKHGNLKKQQALKERLNKGVPLNLDEDEFSVHECAAVLKYFLAHLPEPLLTDAYYRAHCQVPLLCRDSMSDEDKRVGYEKQLSCLQLLFQLIPEVNYTLLKDLLLFLHSVSKNQDTNKMSAKNLGTVFATHILCPRKMSPEALQASHRMLGNAVSFMIENAEKLFTLPDQLILDIENFVLRKPVSYPTPKTKGRKPTVNCTPKGESPVVNTVFSFVDREASKSSSNATDQALAALYAHVQSMPESAQKRKLVTKLNTANGKGTPDVATSGSVRTVGRQQPSRRHRRKSGGGGGNASGSVGGDGGLINLLTPRRKRTLAAAATPHSCTGSYNLRQLDSSSVTRHSEKQQLVTPLSSGQQLSSFRRQNSLQPPKVTVTPIIISPSQSSPNIISPRNRLSSPVDETPASRMVDEGVKGAFSADEAETPASQTSDVCAPVDEVDTPGKTSDLDDREEERLSTGDHEGSFLMAPPLPPRTPAPTTTNAVSSDKQSTTSPLTRASSLLPADMLQAALTPRSRAPVMVCSSSQLEKWSRIVDSSSPALRNYRTTEESELNGSFDQESDGYFASLENEDSETEENLGEVQIGLQTAKNTKDKVGSGEQEDENYARRKDSCRTRSLSSDFKQYLARQGLEVPPSPNDASNLEDSVFSDCEANYSYSTDVRRLLQEGEKLSTSMQAVLDGEDPADLFPGQLDKDPDLLPPKRKSPRISQSPASGSNNVNGCLSSPILGAVSPNRLTPTLLAAADEVDRTLSRGSSTSTLKATEVSTTEDENTDPNSVACRRGRKRRSITETGAHPPHTTGQTIGNIFFETDL